MITSVSGYGCRQAAPSAAGFRQGGRRGTGRGCRPRGPPGLPPAGTCARSRSVLAVGTSPGLPPPPREGPRHAGRRIFASYHSQPHKVVPPAPREMAPPETKVKRTVPVHSALIG